MGSYGGLSERAFDINEPVIEAQWEFFGSRNLAAPGFEPTLEFPSSFRTLFNLNDNVSVVWHDVWAEIEAKGWGE